MRNKLLFAMLLLGLALAGCNNPTSASTDEAITGWAASLDQPYWGGGSAGARRPGWQWHRFSHP